MLSRKLLTLPPFSRGVHSHLFVHAGIFPRMSPFLVWVVSHPFFLPFPHACFCRRSDHFLGSLRGHGRHMSYLPLQGLPDDDSQPTFLLIRQGFSLVIFTLIVRNPSPRLLIFRFYPISVFCPFHWPQSRPTNFPGPAPPCPTWFGPFSARPSGSRRFTSSPSQNPC